MIDPSFLRGLCVFISTIVLGLFIFLKVEREYLLLSILHTSLRYLFFLFILGITAFIINGIHIKKKEEDNST